MASGCLGDQLVQRLLLSRKLDHGGRLRMRADPQFGKRSAGCVFHAQQIRDEVVAAPVVVLNHPLQRQYPCFNHQWLSPSCAGYPRVLRRPWPAIASARLWVSATA